MGRQSDIPAMARRSRGAVTSVGVSRATAYVPAEIGSPMRLRTIGLIGGVSWESSAMYYRLINEGIRATAGADRSAPILMYSFDYREMNALVQREEWVEAGKRIGEVAARLEGAGAEAIALCCNTLHIGADEIERRLAVPFIDITQQTAIAAAKAGYRKALLLGTGFTMRHAFFRSRLESVGVATIIPGKEGIADLNRIIFDEAARGLTTDSGRATIGRILREGREKGADCGILGCTELGMLISQDVAPLPLLDTLSIHVHSLTEFVLGG